ncbi:MAG: hypothetical protein AAGF55_02135 [Pseudomonadota bacterium]
MKTVAAIAFALIASPALSLSCLRPDIVRMYEQAREAEAGYWLVRGQLFSNTPLATPQPEPDGRFKDNASADSTAQFQGQGLHRDGFRDIPDMDITVKITCLAHWCGGVPLEEDLLMAIEVTETGPVLLAPPCSSRVIRFSKENEARLLRCAIEGVCSSQGN